MVKGDLAEIGGHVLNFPVVTLLRNHQLREKVDSGVTNGPLEGVEDVHLHLGEHAGIVQAAAHVVEFVDLRNTVLLVTILRSDQ
jgi:hypothetical protein